MEVERAEVHNPAVEDGAVAARIDGGIGCGMPALCLRRGLRARSVLFAGALGRLRLADFVCVRVVIMRVFSRTVRSLFLAVLGGTRARLQRAGPPVDREWTGRLFGSDARWAVGT